jgi:hypothetical protein
MPRPRPDPTENRIDLRNDPKAGFHLEPGAALKSPGAHLMNNTIKNVEVGKYLVSPLSKLADDGRYQASVSIRSGRGSATHDRVLRFLKPFTNPDEALAYATSQGLAWVHERARGMLN